MYNYDQILASGYYVFREELTTSMVCNFISLLIGIGSRFTSEDLRLKELRRILIINDNKFYLKEGFRLEDIAYLVDDNLVLMFQEFKDVIDTHSKDKRKIKIRGIY